MPGGGGGEENKDKIRRIFYKNKSNKKYKLIHQTQRKGKKWADVDRTKGGAQKSGIWQTDKQTRQDRQVGWPGGVGTKHTDTLIQSQTDRQIEG